MIPPEFIIKLTFITEPRHRFLSFLEKMDCAYHDVQKSQPAITCSKLTMETLEQGV